MKVSDLFERLAYGELSNLSMVDENNEGTILAASHGKLLSYVNSALDDLHKRFVLRTGEVLIEQFEGITKYVLKKKYALSSPEQVPHKYIIDFAEPFQEDVIRILEVYNQHGDQLYLNDPGQPNSVFTPTPTTLQIPLPKLGAMVSVGYQAKAVPLSVNPDEQCNIDVLDQEIDIPVFLENALIAKIAYKAYSHMNGQEHQIKAQEYISVYENECTEVEDSDLMSQSQSTTHHKLEHRGFK